MQITKVTARRVRNLGNYETAQMEAEATVAEGENPDDVAYALLQWVEDRLGVPDVRRVTAPLGGPEDGGF